MNASELAAAGSAVEEAAGIGALARQARQAAGMSQQALADRIGTTRQWVIRFEQGSPASMLRTVLAALDALGLEIVAQFDPAADR